MPSRVTSRFRLYIALSQMSDTDPSVTLDAASDVMSRGGIPQRDDDRHVQPRL